MKAGYSHLAIALDASGSMGRVKDATIESVGKLIEEQKKVGGEASVQLFTFNKQVQVGELKPLDQFEKPTRRSYVCKGDTALYDSIAKAIDSTGQTLAAMPEDQRPEKVIVAIVTDSLDRGSQSTADDVRGRVRHQTEQYNWLVLLLVANADAVHEAGRIGVDRDNAIRFTVDNGGVRAAFHRLSNQTANYRRGGRAARIELANVVASR